MYNPTHSATTPLLDFKGETYQLLPSAQTTHVYALEHVNRNTLRKIVTPEQGEHVTEAVLAPMESATKIGAWVQGEFLGILLDSQLLLKSQLSRVFASGHLIGCQLLLSPSKGTLASVLLPDLDFAIIMNEGPQQDAHLLPKGAQWQVEPTVNTLFNNLLPNSTVLFELKHDLDTLTISYNGIECGVLSAEDAAALCTAVRFSVVNGLIPTVVGQVVRSHGAVTIEIDALPFELWSKKQYRVELLNIPQLVPYHADTQAYADAAVHFSQSIFQPQSASKRSLALPEKVLIYAPHLALAIGLLSLIAFMPVRNVNNHGWTLFAIISFILLAFAGVILCTKKRPTSSQRLNLVTSVGLLTSLPVVAFLAAGPLITEGKTKGPSLTEPQQTTLANSPPNSAIVHETDASEQPSLITLQSPTMTIPSWRDQAATTILQENPDSSELLPESSLNFPESISHPPGTSANRHGIDNGDNSETQTSTSPKATTTTEALVAVPPTFIRLPDDIEPVETTEVTEIEEPTEPTETSEPSEPKIEIVPLIPFAAQTETTEAPVETTEASTEISVSEEN